MEIRPLTAEPVTGTELPIRLKVDPERGDQQRLEVLWPDAESKVELKFRATERQGGSVAEHVIDLSADIVLSDGREVHASRTIRVSEPATTLFEVFSQDERALTLALQTEIATETVIPSAPTVGRRVLLELEIQRVIEGRAISLERNQLNTFEGEQVSYSFKLGESGVADAMLVRLRPMGITGSLTRIEIEVSGSLPSESGTNVIDRREVWMTSRDSTSTFAVETGDPPTGYRFLVTPRFY